MNFTGTELQHTRNFYIQTGNFGFIASFTFDNTTGTYNLGVSGQQYNFNIIANSGKLYKDNLFLGTYRPYETFTLEAQLNTGNYNLIKNRNATVTPLVYGIPKNTGYFDYFYLNRSNGSIGATIDLYVSGDNVPNFNIPPQGYLISSSQNAVTGLFLNNSQFYINTFNSSANGLQNLNFGLLTGIIPAFGTGFFIYSGDFTQFNFNQPISTIFNTNFDDVNVLFYINDLRSFNTFIIFNPITNFNFSNNILNRNLVYNNYSGTEISNNFNANISIKLQYITGDGTFSSNEFAPTANFLTTGYGNFLQSGFLTGIANIPTGNSFVTGNYVIDCELFSWATGKVSIVYSGVGTGTASGIGYTGIAEGEFSGTYTGFIYNGSGTLSLNGLFTGSAQNASSINYPLYTNATGYLNISGLQRNDSFYIGVMDIPIVRGLQYNNETGLIYYLSGQPLHMVEGLFSGGNVYLTSRIQGTAGNGIFIRQGQCDFGSFISSPFLTGGFNSGTTGNSVVPISPFTGALNFILTGSGNYSGLISGNSAGTFLYTTTFTGGWDLLTGLTNTSLVSMKSIGNYNANVISGLGSLTPNGPFNFQINHTRNTLTPDYAFLIISGSGVVNPIIQILS